MDPPPSPIHNTSGIRKFVFTPPTLKSIRLTVNRLIKTHFEENRRNSLLWREVTPSSYKRKLSRHGSYKRAYFKLVYMEYQY